MKNNITKYAIIVYIIVIIFLYLFRPNIIYNQETKQFRDFGFERDQSILALPILAIILAILIYIIFSLFANNNQSSIPKEYTEMFNKMIGGNKSKLKFMAHLPMLINQADLYENIIE